MECGYQVEVIHMTELLCCRVGRECHLLQCILYSVYAILMIRYIYNYTSAGFGCPFVYEDCLNKQAFPYACSLAGSSRDWCSFDGVHKVHN